MTDEALDLLGSPELPDDSPDRYANLRPAEQRYVDLVCEGMPKLKAAREIGRTGKSYNVYRGLARLDPAIAERRAWLAKQADVNVQRIAGEHAKLGFANIQDVVDTAGNVIPLHELPRDVAAAVASFDVVETEVNAELKTRTYKYKFHPKAPSLEALVKLFGLEAPKKVAITDSEGHDLPNNELEGARRIAFALALAARKMDAVDHAVDITPEEQ